MLKKMLMLCLLGSIAFAGEVVLTDGSILKGEVTEIFGGKLKVKTDFAGELTIDRDKVTSFTTDGAVNLYGADGKVYSGVVKADGLQTADGTVAPLNQAEVGILWPEGAKDPTLPPERKWTYQIAGDFTKKSGNTDKRSIGAEARAELAGPVDKFLMYLRSQYSKEYGVETERMVVGGLDYERSIAKTDNSWYVRSEYKYDKYGDLDPEVTAAAGYGFYFLKQENAQIRARLGLSYVNRSHISDLDSSSSFGVDANYHHEFKFQKLLFADIPSHLITDVTWVPSFDNFQHDWHLIHESSLSLPLGGSKFWSIRLGILNDYYSRVAPGKDRMDTTYFARIVFTWD